MFKKILIYISASLIAFIILLLTIDYIVLPAIANRNKEVYLPDVRGINLEKAQLALKDFNVKVFYTRYKEGYILNEVLNMSPRAFTKVKEGRDVNLTIIGEENDCRFR